jgi:formiminoglutamate deiminase
MTGGSWFAENAWVDGRLLGDVVIDTADGVIAGVRSGALRPPGAALVRGVVLPGLVNGHSHAFHRLLRGGGEDPSGPGDFWSWREAMYHMSFRLDPPGYRRLARAVFAEMALAGVTTVGEFHYVHHGVDGLPYDDPNEMGKAVIAAATEAGIRITLIDAAYLRSGFGDDPLNRFQARFADHDIAAWADRLAALVAEAPGPRVRVGVAAHSVRALRPDDLRGVAEVAGELDLPLHFHLSEQPAENDGCLARFGRTPARVMADAGALGPRSTAVHATHLTADDLELLGGSGTGVCLCPTTERELGDGLGPAAELFAAGCRLSVGSDGHAVIDLLEEARAVELHDRLRLGRRHVHAPDSLLAAATRGGARSLGWPEGALREGDPADFVAVDVDNVRLAGWRPADGVAPLLHSATAADVTDVVVAGEHVVAARRHRHLDVVEELGAAIAAMRVRSD